jgi:asparagine N-glycosylation enzyme membrane subunit Stt3
VARDRIVLPAVLLVVAGASWFLRDLHHQRVPAPDGVTWVTTDPDTHYQCRRVERAIREGRIAALDDRMNFPDGAPIPWPPYYTAILSAALGPFVPEDVAARSRWIEMRVASFPILCGIATSVLAALAGAMLAGPAAAMIAGATHAACQASIAYSRSGNGDHHAWVSLLAGAMLVLTSRALRPGGLARPARAAAEGVAVGAIAGLALGSWVASLLYVIPLQLVLGWLLVVHGREPRPGLAAFGIAIHAAALVVLLPAIWTSPWRKLDPWIVVNLSWFHAAWLALGGLVFVPPLVLPPRVLRIYPAVVVVALAALAAVLVATGRGPGAGVREGFAWMGRDSAFMGAVWESRGLFGKNAVYPPLHVFGWGLLVLPFAWAGVAWLAFRRGRLELLPWAIAVPLLAAQAARQFRFGDALSLPLAVVVAWGVVEGLRSLRSKPRVPIGATLAAAFVLPLLAQWNCMTRTWGNLTKEGGPTGQPEQPGALAMRGMCDWLRTRTPSPPDYSVLASWVWGHTIEWAAERPTIATNFGTFVGPAGFKTPARFFLSESPTDGEALLEARDAKYVVLTTDLAGSVPSLAWSLGPGIEARYCEVVGDDVRLKPDWFATLGARLLSDGYMFSFEGTPSRPLDFVRLLHATPLTDPRVPMQPKPSPVGWIWERVPGARIEARGEPGQELAVEIRVRYPHHELVWADHVAVAADGVARMRVPYATIDPNGDGRAESASWTIGDRRGPLPIATAAVFGVGAVRVGD